VAAAEEKVVEGTCLPGQNFKSGTKFILNDVIFIFSVYDYKLKNVSRGC